MLYNSGESEVMHFNFNNNEAECLLGNARFSYCRTGEEFGIIIYKSLYVKLIFL